MASFLSSFASSSSSLFSSLVDSTIGPSLDDVPNPSSTLEAINSQPRPSTPPPQPQFPSTPNQSPTHLSTPLLSSTPIPNTQQLTSLLVGVRSVDGIDAVALKRENESLKSELTAVRLQNEERQRNPNSADNDEHIALKRENEELRSERTALRLQLEEQKLEIDRLKAEQQPPPPPPLPLADPTHPNASLPPTLAADADGYLPVLSKGQKQRMRKRERIEAAAAVTLPPGCDSIHPPSPLPSRPPPQRQQQQQPPQQSTNPNAYIYHDSNLKGTTAVEIANLIKNINSKNNNNNQLYNIILQDTFTLPQTLEKIRKTKYNNNDKIIINTLTNDARNTKARQRRTPHSTQQIQTQIIQHLISFVPRNNITILESPPLLDSPSSDIYPYNANSYSLSQRMGINFSGTLIGEQHVWKGDGYHILRSIRPLLAKSVAAAVAGVNPRQHFGLARPPFGQYGPWSAPKGTGILPSYRDRAMTQPFLFRRSFPIRPLMNINIR